MQRELLLVAAAAMASRQQFEQRYCQRFFFLEEKEIFKNSVKPGVSLTDCCQMEMYGNFAMQHLRVNASPCHHVAKT